MYIGCRSKAIKRTALYRLNIVPYIQPWLFEQMKFLAFLLLGAVAAQSTCTIPCGSNEKCLLRPDANEYNCFNLQKNSGDFGILRKCTTPSKNGCRGSNTPVDDPSECCSGIAYVMYVSSIKDFGLGCRNAVQCDRSEGCTVNVQCPDSQYCIKNKCVTPKPGIDCGECGKLPIEGRCCGSGIRGRDGNCYCVSGSSSCTNDSDCLGGSGGLDRICCGGKCCGRSSCRSGSCS